MILITSFPSRLAAILGVSTVRIGTRVEENNGADSEREFSVHTGPFHCTQLSLNPKVEAGPVNSSVQLAKIYPSAPQAADVLQQPPYGAFT